MPGLIRDRGGRERYRMGERERGVSGGRERERERYGGVKNRTNSIIEKYWAHHVCVCVYLRVFVDWAKWLVLRHGWECMDFSRHVWRVNIRNTERKWESQNKPETCQAVPLVQLHIITNGTINYSLLAAGESHQNTDTRLITGSLCVCVYVCICVSERERDGILFNLHFDRDSSWDQCLFHKWAL